MVKQFTNDAYTKKGDQKAESGDLKGALADYDQAIKNNHQLAPAYNNRALVKKKLGDFEGAVEGLVESLGKV